MNKKLIKSPDLLEVSNYVPIEIMFGNTKKTNLENYVPNFMSFETYAEKEAYIRKTKKEDPTYKEKRDIRTVAKCFSKVGIVSKDIDDGYYGWQNDCLRTDWQLKIGNYIFLEPHLKPKSLLEDILDVEYKPHLLKIIYAARRLSLSKTNTLFKPEVI